MTGDRYDDLAANVAALIEKHRVRHAEDLDKPIYVEDLRALLGGDTTALDRRLADHGKRIAAAIEALPPETWGTGWTPMAIDAYNLAIEEAAQVARAGGTP